MCCSFFPFFNTRNQFLRLFFFPLLVFRPDTFSLSLFLCFPPPFSFSPPLCSVSFPPLFLYYLSPFSLYPLFLSLNVPALLPGPGHWCGGPREHFRPDLCAFWCGLGCAVPTHSHSGLLICDIHFGITHHVPHHCSPALIVFVRKFTPLLWRRACLLSGCLSGHFHSLTTDFCP